MTLSELPFRLRFLTVLVLPAAALMAMEIVSSRLLSPTFGNSVYVWGAIISVFLAAMSIGYVAGGRLADREPSLAALGRVLLLAALMVGFAMVWGRHLVAAIGGLAHGRPSGALWACAVVYGPAIVCLSTVAPFAVRLAGSQSGRLGGIAGGLYALSTAGSLAGTLAATFVLIPRFDLDAIMGVLLSATALAGLAGLWSGQGWVSRGLMATCCLLAVWPWWPGGDRGLSSLVLVERITPYQTLRVLEQDGIRTLQSDGTLHGAIDVATGAPSRQRPNYWTALGAAWLLAPEARRVTVLGLGAGDGARYIAERFPQASVQVVEIDPAMLEVAQTYFALRVSPRLSVALDDARRYLDAHEGPWDIIVADTYIGQSIPFHLATAEFFSLVKSRLAPGGVLVVNVAAAPDRPFARAILRTLHGSFGHVLAVRAGFNHLLLACDVQRPDSVLTATAKRLDRELGGAPSFESYLGQRVTLDVDLTTVPALRDDFAPVDALLDLSSAAEVESLRK